MKKPNTKYWVDRALQRETIYNAGSDAVVRQLEKLYQRSFENIKADIAKIDKKLETFKDTDSAAAYLARKSRLEELQSRVDAEFVRLAKTEEAISAARYRSVISEGYYRSIFDMQKGFGAAFKFAALPEKTILETLKAGWKGRNYSKRVWGNTAVLAQSASEVIESGFMTGKSIARMTEELDNLLGVGQRVSERLIRTETNYFANQGELRSYDEVGIEYYRYLATLDMGSRSTPSGTCETCAKLDNKAFPVKDATVGDNYPPMHPWCRCTTVAVFEDEDLSKIERRARDPVTGKLYTVPADMSYGEWKKSLGLAANTNDSDDGMPTEIKLIETLTDLSYDNITKVLMEYEKQIVGQSYESAIVVTKSGEVYRIDGSSSMVHPEALGDKLIGASVTHNHPEEETEFSFSAQDHNRFYLSKMDRLRAIDYKYTYELSQTPIPDYEGLKIADKVEYRGEMMMHGDSVRRAKEFGYYYRRWFND